MTDAPVNPGQPKSGTINITSSPAGAPVLLDGTATGRVTPAALENISAGRHVIAITLPDCTIISREVAVTADSTINVCLRKLTKEETDSIRIIGVYTIGCVVLLVGLAIINRLYFYPIDDLTQLMIYIACSGGLGSLAFSIFGYIDHLGKNDFDLSFFGWYILRPLIGIIYGTFAFLFVAGGLMSLSGIDPGASLYTTKTVMFYCALAFLAGYAEHAFSLQLKELAEALFKKEGA
ncbi:MAG TPA: PEGA domain-containing protein [Methanoregula sp.]|nr:PEGA domain-containing protein [Methanoregula sp.]